MDNSVDPFHVDALHSVFFIKATPIHAFKYQDFAMPSPPCWQSKYGDLGATKTKEEDCLLVPSFIEITYLFF